MTEEFYSELYTVSHFPNIRQFPRFYDTRCGEILYLKAAKVQILSPIQLCIVEILFNAKIK